MAMKNSQDILFVVHGNKMTEIWKGETVRMKRALAIMLASAMIICSADMMVYANGTTETVEAQKQETTEATEQAETEETEKANEKPAIVTEQSGDTETLTDTEEVTEETESEESNEDAKESVLEEAYEILDGDAYTNYSKLNEEQKKAIADYFMDGLEQLPDDPEYLMTLQDRMDNMYDSATTSFEYNNYKHNDRFAGYNIRKGIDVSYYQKSIDWNKVKNSGIEFVFIRLGYRGYKEGTLNKDSKADEYIQGALNAGLRVGGYIFSQAVNEAEAQEEARYAMSIASGYNITMPIVIDYEYVSNGVGRLYNAHLSKEQATANVNAFCSSVISSGYTPAVYANKSMLENNMIAANIPYKVWLANYTKETSYQGNYDFWQCDSKTTIDGVNGFVDFDFWYDGAKDNVYTQTIADGSYVIESALGNGMQLAVAGESSANGANVQLGNGMQVFNVKYLGSGKYSITSASSDKVLDAMEYGKVAGANVEQYTWNGGSNQQWYIQDAGNGYYYIRSAASELCLDVWGGQALNGANVQLWDMKYGSNQQFRFVKTVNRTRTVEDGVYSIESALGSGMRLDVTNASGSNGANIEIWNGTQEFQISYVSDGAYAIKAMCSGKYLEAESGNAGANVRQNDWTGASNQLWYFENADNGRYFITSAAGDVCLDVWGGQAKNGSNVQVWTPKNGTNQKFNLNKITYTQTIADGIYTIESGLQGGYLLDVNTGSPYDNANVQLWKGSQSFKVTYLGDGKYSLMATCSGRYLDVAQGGKTAGTNVIQFGGNGGENQKWYIQDVGNGYYNIKSASNYLNLDVWGGQAKNGANIQLWNPNGGYNQKFRFNKITYGKTIENGTYTIESALGSGMLLDVYGASKENEANVQLYKGSQTFNVTYIGDGTYEIIANCSGKSLDAARGGTTAGTNIIQFNAKRSENQKWYIQDAGNGYYYIRTAGGLLCLDVWGGQAANGANVQLWGFNGGNNQRFRFNKVR